MVSIAIREQKVICNFEVHAGVLGCHEKGIVGGIYYLKRHELRGMRVEVGPRREEKKRWWSHLRYPFTHYRVHRLIDYPAYTDCRTMQQKPRLLDWDIWICADYFNVRST